MNINWQEMNGDELIEEATRILCEQNPVENIELLICLFYTAYEKGLSEGAAGLANVYSNHINNSFSNKKTVYWLTTACSMGSSVACGQLALAYQFGDFGLEQNQQLAKDYLKKSSDIDD